MSIRIVCEINYLRLNDFWVDRFAGQYTVEGFGNTIQKHINLKGIVSQQFKVS